LRPDIPPKSGTVPSTNNDRSPLVDNQASVTSEVNRPCGSAAAMLGIALSLGAGSLAAPCFQVVAQAVESTPSQISMQSPVVAQESLLTTVVQSPVAVVPQAVPQVVEPAATASEAAVTQPTVATIVAAPAVSDAMTPTTGHAVKPGETLWQIAKSYQVEVRALATANRLSTDAALKVGQVLQLPAANGGKPAETTVSLAAISQSVPVVPALAATAADTVNADMQARQTASVAALRSQRDRLKQSLAELGEESKSAVFVEGQVEAAAAQAAPATSGLPVTRLANVPLPAIGGAEPQVVEPQVAQPQVIARRPVDTQVDAKVETKVSSASLPVAPEPQSNFNPSPLLAEIHNLRNRHSRQQQSMARPTLVAQVVATEPPAARVEPLKPQSVAANPDFANRKSDSALSIELRNFVQPKLKPEGTEKVRSAPSANAQVVARATLGSEAYAPVTPAVRKMVAPNLPAIGKADAYLPGGTMASNGYVWPSQGILSSGYGWRWGRMHKGIDIAAPTGTPIVAVASGTVVSAGWNDGGYGYLVEVEHGDGTLTRYAHNNRILVKSGQQVAQGQQVSEMGSTGFSTGPHLHFEVHPRGSGAVNPIAFLGNQS
jgi:murein DD-endopeptidase MepM/ murein hydrolase activator NlpD